MDLLNRQVSRVRTKSDGRVLIAALFNLALIVVLALGAMYAYPLWSIFWTLGSDLVRVGIVLGVLASLAMLLAIVLLNRPSKRR